jgi:hypothetical protein
MSYCRGKNSMNFGREAKEANVKAAEFTDIRPAHRSALAGDEGAWRLWFD